MRRLTSFTTRVSGIADDPRQPMATLRRKPSQARLRQPVEVLSMPLLRFWRSEAYKGAATIRIVERAGVGWPDSKPADVGMVGG
jgi:hypothetical protein